MSIKFNTTVQTDASTEDYYIQIPEEILNYLNWKEGDTLDWNITDSKQIIITKIKDCTSTKEEPTMSDYDWYTVKEEAIEEYLNSESEGKEYKDYDEAYDDYIEASIEETSSLEGYEFTQD